MSEEIDSLEIEVVLFYGQSFETTEKMTFTRLKRLYDLAIARNKKTNTAQTGDKTPTETRHLTEEQKAAATENILKAAFAQQEAQKTKLKNVRYVD